LKQNRPLPDTVSKNALTKLETSLAKRFGKDIASWSSEQPDKLAEVKQSVRDFMEETYVLFIRGLIQVSFFRLTHSRLLWPASGIEDEGDDESDTSPAAKSPSASTSASPKAATPKAKKTSYVLWRHLILLVAAY
jgi:hypothetical protein